MFSRFALFIKEERKKKGFSTRTLSEKINRSSSYISQFERGLIKDIPYSVALKIVNALGVDERTLNNFYDTESKLMAEDENESSSYFYLTEADLDSIRENVEHTLQQHIQHMNTNELTGLLLLLNSQRDLLYSLSQVPSTVRPDKVSHVLDSIKKYTKFMTQEYPKTKEEIEEKE
jgi:transcriptional regulator with XRE-family HTH domain